MTNEKTVADFKAKLDKVFKAYFISELCADTVEIAVGIIAIMYALNAENQRALMLSVLFIFIAVFATSFVIIRIFFGSVSGMNKIVSFRTRYDFVSKNLQDAERKLNKGKITADDYNIAKAIYDDEIKSLFDEIERISVKK